MAITANVGVGALWGHGLVLQQNKGAPAELQKQRAPVMLLIHVLGGAGLEFFQGGHNEMYMPVSLEGTQLITDNSKEEILPDNQDLWYVPPSVTEPGRDIARDGPQDPTVEPA